MSGTSTKETFLAVADPEASDDRRRRVSEAKVGERAAGRVMPGGEACEAARDHERVTLEGDTGEEAAEHVMADLINTLLAEGFWDRAELALHTRRQWKAVIDGSPALAVLADKWDGMAGVPERTGPDEPAIYCWRTGGSDGYVCFPVRRAVVQPYRYVEGGGVYRIEHDAEGLSGIAVERLSPVRLMELVIGLCLREDGREQAGAGRFLQLLDETVRQLSWSLDNSIPGQDLLSLSPAAFFQKLERYAALRDRPFHPVAKAKSGLRQDDYRRFIAEFGRDISLRWVAVRRERVIAGSGTAADAPESLPVELLLSCEERKLVAREMAERGLAQESFIAIPVHPWQMDVVAKQLPLAFESGICVPLDVEAGVFQATSSARSLAPRGEGRHYVKLALSVSSLGASRYLPAVKLMNGERGQALLSQAKARDEVLGERLFLCEETKWWGYMPDGGSLFDDPPRHLGAMVRAYPQELASDSGARLVPMSALAAEMKGDDRHFFDVWMKARGMAVSEATVIRLFGEVCAVFFDISLRLFRIGLLPEIHGQNCVLVWRDGRIDSMLLRDHDSVRLHLPWLGAEGIGDPQYLIRPGHSNSLYNETPEELLFYLQTLGIQVNLYSIIDMLSSVYSICERTLWRTLRESLQGAMLAVPFRTEVRAQMEKILLNRSSWPLKLLVKPLLEQEGGVSGSMPSGKGTVQNPFRCLSD